MDKFHARSAADLGNRRARLVGLEANFVFVLPLRPVLATRESVVEDGLSTLVGVAHLHVFLFR